MEVSPRATLLNSFPPESPTHALHLRTHRGSQQTVSKLCCRDAVRHSGQSGREAEQHRAPSARRNSSAQDRRLSLSESPSRRPGNASPPRTTAAGQPPRGEQHRVVPGSRRCAQGVCPQDVISRSSLGWQRWRSTRGLLAVQRHRGGSAGQRTYASLSATFLRARPGFPQRERRTALRHRSTPRTHHGARHLGHRPRRRPAKAPGAGAGGGSTLCHALHRTADGARPAAPSLWWIAQIYLTQWKIEETFRFIKQSYRLEDLRVRRYHRLKNLVLLMTAAAYFATAFISKTRFFSRW